MTPRDFACIADGWLAERKGTAPQPPVSEQEVQTILAAHAKKEQERNGL